MRCCRLSGSNLTVARCHRCRSLDLSAAQFNIEVNRPGRLRLPKAGFSPRHANSRFFLGTYGDIEARQATCPFCRLVYKSVDRSTLSLPQENDGASVPASPSIRDTKCFLTWELDGRSIDEKNQIVIKARTRRIHIHWDSNAVPDAFAIFLTPREPSSLANMDGNAVWTTSDHFRARRINQDSSKIALIRDWLYQCLHEHDGSCREDFERERNGFAQVAQAAHFGVLDVVEMRLTSLPRRSASKSPVSHEDDECDSSSDESDRGADGLLFEPYVALSYVWGSKEDQQGFERLLTRLNNVMTRGFQNAIEKDLKSMPKVIQSSVELVRRLGYRYLWIDSICIVQDSTRSWKWNSEVMDRIYSNAEFTICAADGNSAKAGLVAFDKPEASSEQIIERCASGVRLMISRDVESQIASSAWNKRAWTFQERLLSHRCLIFTQGRVFFQCRRATFSEDIVTSPQASAISAWSLDLVRSPLVLLSKLKERPFWFYMNCVQLFSGRRLTKSTDVLAAFNGVSNLIEGAMTGPLAFGLPTSHFDLALLWTPKQALKRRIGGDFPSWSWCGWEGGSASYFVQDFIQDCLENVHQWLKSYTWIQWHIRDSQSKLRPLWFTCDRVPANQEQRWKGYNSYEYSEEKYEEKRDERIKLLVAALNEKETQGVSFARGRDFSPGDVGEPIHLRHRKPPAPPEERPREEDDYERSRVTRLQRNDRGHEEQYHYDIGQERDEHRRRPYSPDRKIYEAGQERSELRRPYSPSRREYDDGQKPPEDHYEVYQDGPPPRKEAFRSRLSDPPLDPYGRPVLGERRGKERTFKKRAPESPFAVYKAELMNQFLSEPDSPILQFWTDSVWLYLVEPSDDSEAHPDESGGSSATDNCGPGLQRYGIADATGDWCGSIVLDKEWAQGNMRQPRNGSDPVFQFLALSRAKRFTKDECGTWSFYVPLDRQQSEWDLNYVMLVETQSGVHYRVGVGKVFQHAFRNGVRGSSRWEEVVLG
ncbi:heterokaryon incompatibility protein-domain-containing protein [Phyllosticta citrichinensis]|uniref:Heterokaryon incompatibility protein-domain-containing protein n=1 Tax=Phyllosticta citrichinensis TaxID=1130410 RepID=A0ABR1XL26_9PEZI